LNNLVASLLSTDNTGKVSATTTVGTNYLTGSLGSINGTPFSVGSSITVGSASTTLLSDTNTFSGNTTLTNATSSNFAITSLSHTLLAVNANGSVIATSTIGANLISGSLGSINGVNFVRGGSITIAAASSTLLSDSNTFSGSNTFSSTITGSISGNAGTAT